jgi:hypothetical protein
MLRYGLSHDKAGLLLATLATAMTMSAIEYLRDIASSAVTGVEPKYDITTPEGQIKLLKKGLDYATPIGAVTIPLQQLNAIFNNKAGMGLLQLQPGMAVPNQIAKILTDIKSGNITADTYKTLIYLLPISHYPIIGDLLQKELQQKFK